MPAQAQQFLEFYLNITEPLSARLTQTMAIAQGRKGRGKTLI
jgi:hypothetical protein